MTRAHKGGWPRKRISSGRPVRVAPERVDWRWDYRNAKGEVVYRMMRKAHMLAAARGGERQGGEAVQSREIGHEHARHDADRNAPDLGIGETTGTSRTVRSAPACASARNSGRCNGPRWRLSVT